MFCDTAITAGEVSAINQQVSRANLQEWDLDGVSLSLSLAYGLSSPPGSSPTSDKITCMNERAVIQPRGDS